MPIVLRRSHRADLESHLKGSVHRWLASSGLVPFEEVTTSWGIVDVLGIRANVGNVMERLRAGHNQPIGDFRSILILLFIPTEKSRRSVSRTELHVEFGELLGAATVDRIVEKLIRKRMVAHTAGRRLFRVIDTLPYHDELVCVELKLSRIDDVLAQARRHRVAATSSFVGLPQEVAEKVAASRKGDFKDYGVGLLAITIDHCSVLVPAGSTGSERERAHEIAVAEKCWSAILKAIQH
jgi:hypothetical protein